MGDIRRDIFSEPKNSPGQRGTTNGVPHLKLKDLEGEEFEPVSSQKFESPKETKQLSSHRFRCNCEPSPEPYACASAYNWLVLAYRGRKFEI